MSDIAYENPGALAIVDRSTFQAEVDALRVREKAHTRETADIRALLWGHLSGVVVICEVAGSALGSEIGLCLDLTIRLTRSGSLGLSR
ncbi:hypothetical protein [Mesorhizobium sp. M0047]|uniref:hypothetical protein n=1 Tax=Mesorhizobium sp. M0047 TaxID=2956859 RepID=UPI0033352D3A